MRHRYFAVGTAILLAAPATAEPVLEVFAGRGWAERTPLTLTSDSARINGQVVPAALRIDVASVKPTSAANYGARLGYWFGSTFGIALDVATLDPDVRAQTVRATGNIAFDESVFGEPVRIDAGDSVDVAIPRVTVPTTGTIAALAMIRLPIGATPERPAGRVAPYAFAGPVYLVTDTDLDGKFGLRAGGGAKLAITRGLGVFAEYRYTRVNASAVAGRFSGAMNGISGSTGDIVVDLRLRNHAAVGGVSLSF